VLNKVHLAQYDPWISYAILILLALAALHLIEKPAQKRLRKLMSAN
jgi:peptidoglycan/LPS O-acetylase OafA/YrhL